MPSLRETLDADWARLAHASGRAHAGRRWVHHFSPRFAPVSLIRHANALQRAVSLYTRRDTWSRMQVQGMTADFSWHQSGARYAELYTKLTRGSA